MSDVESPPDDLEDDGLLPTEQPTVNAASTTTHARQRTSALIKREKIRQFWSSVLRDPVVITPETTVRQVMAVDPAGRESTAV